jgi:competence protein ComGC
MSDNVPQGQRRHIGLVEYALVTALVVVLVIGVLIVLAPAISNIVKTMSGS